MIHVVVDPPLLVMPMQMLMPAVKKEVRLVENISRQLLEPSLAGLELFYPYPFEPNELLLGRGRGSLAQYIHT